MMAVARGCVFAFAVAAAMAAHAQSPSTPAPGAKTYSNTTWRWSVSYPAGWSVDGSDPALVRVQLADRKALCTIMSGAMDRFNTADELANFMIANDTQFFKEKGQKFAVLGQRRIALPNRIAGNDVLAEIGPGQRSRRVYVLADGRGFAIDCETESKNWAGLEADYRRIITSFTVRR